MYFLLDSRSDLIDVFFLIDARFASSFGALHTYQIQPHLFRAICEISDFRIGMQPKDIRRVDNRHIIDLSQETFIVQLGRQRVVKFLRASEEEFFIFVKQEISHIFVQISDQNPPI